VFGVNYLWQKDPEKSGDWDREHIHSLVFRAKSVFKDFHFMAVLAILPIILLVV
jgi:hypothetical protein